MLRLAYRYNSIPIGPISSMQVRINNAFLGSVPLVPGQEASRKMQTRCAGAGGQSAAVLEFAFFRLHLPVAQKGRLPGHDADQHAGRDSARLYLDLRGYPHYAPMPNLETFRQRGLSVYARCRPERDHGGAAAGAHRAGDRDLCHADGPLRPADRISRVCA